MTREDTARAVRLAIHLAGRLSRSLDALAPYHPFDAGAVEAADDDLPDAADAFLKRFENLVNHLQDQVWRRIAVEAGFVDPALATRREIADLMERAGLLRSADEFLDVVRVRNLLSHLYPGDPARQARRLNDAYKAAVLLLGYVQAAEAWAVRRGLTPTASP